MTFGYNSMFDNNFSEFDSLDNLVKAVNTTLSKTIKEAQVVNIPLDKYTNEDESLVIEIAVTGISKEDFKANGKVTTQNKEGNNFLTVSYNKPKTEEKEPVRNYIGQRKIKHMDNFTHSEYIAPTYDTNSAKVSLVDGLLTIVIPTKEEVKPVEFTIE